MSLSRGSIRYGAAAVSAVIAAIYYLIGAGILTVVERQSGDASLVVFGVAAGSAFLLGSILLVAFDHRVLWILGAEERTRRHPARGGSNPG